MLSYKHFFSLSVIVNIKSESNSGRLTKKKVISLI